MKFHIAITDTDWFRRLEATGATEANFWKPGASRTFRSLDPGGLFLFKAKQDFGGKIVGGGFFVRYERLPMVDAWSKFGDGNGCRTLSEMEGKIRSFRRSTGKSDENSPLIGCTVLDRLFFFGGRDGLDPPPMSPFVVSGKDFNTADPAAARLLEEVKNRVPANIRADIVGLFA